MLRLSLIHIFRSAAYAAYTDDFQKSLYINAVHRTPHLSVIMILYNPKICLSIILSMSIIKP